MDSYINEAWVKVTSPTNGKLRLTDLLLFFDILEDLRNCKLLSSEYREFLIEFILECPSIEVDLNQFKALMERLFECSFDELIRGKLINNNNNNNDNNNNDNNNSNNNNNFEREDFTQTMNLESTKFNSFMKNGSVNEKESKLRERIKELELMISRMQMNQYQDNRTLNKMKDVLINYYKNLDQLTSLTSNNDSKISKITQRLKLNIDKQDVIIKELKQKVGDNHPDNLIGKIQFFLKRIYFMIWRLLKYPLYILIALIIFNFILYLIYGDNNEGFENYNDVYWDI
jgi:hypothetical protein